MRIFLRQLFRHGMIGIYSFRQEHIRKYDCAAQQEVAKVASESRSVLCCLMSARDMGIHVAGWARTTLLTYISTIFSRGRGSVTEWILSVVSSYLLESNTSVGLIFDVLDPAFWRRICNRVFKQHRVILMISYPKVSREKKRD